MVDRSDEYDLYEEHAGEAAFLWRLRCGAVSDPLYDLDDLCVLDERVEAHIDGLRLAGPEGQDAAEELIAEAEPGAEFVAMCVALHNRDMPSVARLIDLAATEPDLAGGMVSALGWAPEGTVLQVLRGLVFPKLSPALHYLGAKSLATLGAGVNLCIEVQLGQCLAHQSAVGAIFNVIKLQKYGGHYRRRGTTDTRGTAHKCGQ